MTSAQTTPQPGAAALQKRDVAQPPSAEPRGPFAKPSPLRYKRNLPHIQAAEKPIFITFCTADRWELPESVRQAVLEHCLHDHGRKYWLHGVVVMPDHVHMVLSPLRDELACAFGLPEIMNGIKGASAHTVNRVLKRRGHVWQAESFDHILRSQEQVRKKVEYICENPVRKGLVENSDDYRWLWREWIEGVGDVAQPPPAEQEQTTPPPSPDRQHR